MKRMAVTVKGILETGKTVACGVAGMACGFRFSALVFPNHSQPYEEEVERTKSAMERTKVLISKYQEALKNLEEEEAV